MNKQSQIEQLEKDEQELEGMIFGTPPAEKTKEAGATEEKLEGTEVPAEENELVTPEPKPTDEKPPEPKRENWEKRYKNLRSSRDEKLYKSKSQLAAALETINTLQVSQDKLKQDQPKVDPLEGVFTQEDTDALGDATVEAMRKVTKRATEAATKPLQEQLEEEKKLRQSQETQYAQQVKQEAYNIFISRIASVVPDWEAINYDPGFTKWMEDPDLDGTPRKTYFASAEEEGNAALIIRYMKEYTTSKNRGTRKPVEDKLAAKITPTGENAGATQPKDASSGDTISRTFINKFYDDLNRGKYRGRESEALQIEINIDKATMEKRIVD